MTDQEVTSRSKPTEPVNDENDTEGHSLQMLEFRAARSRRIEPARWSGRRKKPRMREDLQVEEGSQLSSVARAGLGFPAGADQRAKAIKADKGQLEKERDCNETTPEAGPRGRFETYSVSALSCTISTKPISLILSGKRPDPTIARRGPGPTSYRGQRVQVPASTRQRNPRRTLARGVADADSPDGGTAAARAAQLAVQAPHLMREQDVQTLQVTAGNKAVQRALSWDQADWSQTKYLDASSGGGGGVLFAGEKGPEVVVKPGEDMPAEGALASFLINKVAAAGGTGFGLAPGYRVPGKAEKQQIKKAFTPLVGKAGQKPRVADLVAKLDDAGVVVQDIAQGKELKEVIEKRAQAHQEEALRGRRAQAAQELTHAHIHGCPRHPCPWLGYRG